jgi:hypothetical protein
MAETQLLPLAEALRAEILKLATEGDPKLGGALTPDVLARVVRVAKTGRDLLVSLSVSPSNLAGMLKHPNSPYLSAIGQNDSNDSVDGSSFGAGMAYAPALPVENFGMTAMRELISAAKSLNGSTSPVKLVEALALAREKGLTDVARDLEAQLGIGKPTPALPPPAKSETIISAVDGLTKTTLQEVQS